MILNDLLQFIADPSNDYVGHSLSYIRLCALAIILAIVIGVPLGAWLGLMRSWLRWPLAALVYTGMGLPPVVVGLLVYFLPVVIAVVRGHQNTAAIFILTLLLGWTFLGWVAALVWSFTAVDRRT